METMAACRRCNMLVATLPFLLHSVLAQQPAPWPPNNWWQQHQQQQPPAPAPWPAPWWQQNQDHQQHQQPPWQHQDHQQQPPPQQHQEQQPPWQHQNQDHQQHQDQDQQQRRYVYFAESDLIYAHPRPRAEYVSAFTSIGVREGEPLKQGTVEGRIEVNGHETGLHDGLTRLSEDGRTLLFKPQQPFKPGEWVTVRVHPGLMTQADKWLKGVQWSFHVSETDLSGYLIYEGNDEEENDTSNDRRLLANHRHLPHGALRALQDASDLPPAVEEMQSDWYEAPYNSYKTIPLHLPRMRIRGPPKTEKLAPGCIFASNSLDRDTVGNNVWYPYAVVVDNSGDLVYYEEREAQQGLPETGTGPPLIGVSEENGHFLAYAGIDIVEKDRSLRFVRRHHPEHGYALDPHDFRLAGNNGNRLFTVQDKQRVNVKGMFDGAPDEYVTLIGAIVQEVDVANNVVMEFRSWDHFELPSLVAQSDARFGVEEPGTAPGEWDLIHQNSATFTDDNSILVSWRRLSAVLKIDRDTGEVMWRFGGTAALNDFTIASGGNTTDAEAEKPFVGQHDATLQGGRLVLFDNANKHANTTSWISSRVVEYELDEANKVATPVFTHYGGLRNKTHRYVSLANGSVQWTKNGTAIVGWGGLGILGHLPFVEEVSRDTGEVLLSFDWKDGSSSYRARKYEWRNVTPHWPPALLLDNGTLYYSWNGWVPAAGEPLAGWSIERANGAGRFEWIRRHKKTRFEHSTDVDASDAKRCISYRAVALGDKGMRLRESNVVASPACFSNLRKAKKKPAEKKTKKPPKVTIVNPY